MMAHIILIVSLFIICDLRAQYYPKASPDSVITKINNINAIIKANLIDSIEIDSMNFLIRELKEYTDALYYTLKWNLAQKQTDKEKRVLMFRQISVYPYYLVSNEQLNKNARVLCEGAIMNLIHEYKGNSEMLKSIYIPEAYRQMIYPLLKREIEGAGGIWDRGPIEPYYDPTIIKRRNSNGDN